MYKYLLEFLKNKIFKNIMNMINYYQDHNYFENKKKNECII